MRPNGNEIMEHGSAADGSRVWLRVSSGPPERPRRVKVQVVVAGNRDEQRSRSPGEKGCGVLRVKSPAVAQGKRLPSAQETGGVRLVGHAAPHIPLGGTRHVVAPELTGR